MSRVDAVPVTRCRRCNDPLPVGDAYTFTGSVVAARSGRTALIEAAEFCSPACVGIAAQRLAVDAAWRRAATADCHQFGGVA